MKVKIGEFTVSAGDTPIMLILTKEDRENIAAMPDDATKFCVFARGTPEADIAEFMKTGKSKAGTEAQQR